MNRSVHRISVELDNLVLEQRVKVGSLEKLLAHFAAMDFLNAWFPIVLMVSFLKGGLEERRS